MIIDGIIPSNDKSGFFAIDDITFTSGCKVRGHRLQNRTKKCTQDYCQNGGTCVVNGQMPSCICLSGYTGDLCESELKSIIVSSTSEFDRFHFHNFFNNIYIFI